MMIPKKSLQMKKVVLGLSNRNNESAITLATGVATGITGNPLFATPPITGVDLQKAIDDFVASNTASKADRSRKAYAKSRTDRGVVTDMLNTLGDYVDMIAQGDENVILSAGMSYTKNREKHPAPTQIGKIFTVFTGIPGSLQVVWERPKFSKWFNVFMTTTPEVATSWKLISTLDTRKLMVNNLASGTRFYFRVVAVNAAGTGPDSEIAEGLAA